MRSLGANPEAQLSVDYRREHGVHNFTTHNRNPNTGNGDQVSVVSQPDWESYYETLGSVPASSDIVLSPELITLDGDNAELPDDAGQLRFRQSAIKSRINKVREFSGDNPNMIVALGTATFNGENDNGSRPRPANSFLFMRGGNVVAHTNQQYSRNGETEELFSLEQVRGGRTVRPDLAGIVGVDLVGEGLNIDTGKPHVPRSIGNFTRTVLMGSGVTLSRAGLSAEGASPEDQMKLLAEKLFESREQVDEIIIADKVPNPRATGNEGPLNAHLVKTLY